MLETKLNDTIAERKAKLKKDEVEKYCRKV
jgi:hypothetical protein